MLSRKLEKSEWQSYFDALSKRLQRQRFASITVVGPYAEITGVRARRVTGEETQWLPLVEIRYDPGEDVLYTLVGSLEPIDHRIAHPALIWAAEREAGAVCDFRVEREDGAQEFIAIRPYQLD